MEALTLFTWGYWGWGTATEQLIQAVDAVETARGSRPPLFVDIRISRSVRAPGFNGRAFEKTLGAARYRWFESLGNLAIREGGQMRIKDPRNFEHSRMSPPSRQCLKRPRRSSHWLGLIGKAKAPWRVALPWCWQRR